jgi:hypothetical protein
MSSIISISIMEADKRVGTVRNLEPVIEPKPVSVYDIWMPTHLKRICLAVNAMSPNLEQSKLGELGLSQGLESH